MEEKKGIKINFMGIISVLTLIIMGVGTTFAYFTVQLNGKLEENVSVSSVEIVMKLKLSPLYFGKPILPTNDEDIFKAYDNKCVDHRGSGACFAYTIEIENSGYPQEGIAIFNATSEEFTNLKYMVVSFGEEYEVLKGPTKAIGATPEEQLEGGIPIAVEEDESRKVVVVVWLSNIQGPQDWEQAGTFEGNVTFSATSGARITGTMTENVIVEKT